MSNQLTSELINTVDLNRRPALKEHLMELSDKEKKRRAGLSKEAQDALAAYETWKAENWPRMYPPKTRFQELHEQHEEMLKQYKK